MSRHKQQHGGVNERHIDFSGRYLPITGGAAATVAKIVNDDDKQRRFRKLQLGR